MGAAGCWVLVLGREPEARIAPERLINVSHRRVVQIDPTVPRLVLELQEALTALGLVEISSAVRVVMACNCDPRYCRLTYHWESPRDMLCGVVWVGSVGRGDSTS